jgi:hypothetical protein
MPVSRANGTHQDDPNKTIKAKKQHLLLPDQAAVVNAAVTAARKHISHMLLKPKAPAKSPIKPKTPNNCS